MVLSVGTLDMVPLDMVVYLLLLGTNLRQDTAIC